MNVVLDASVALKWVLPEPDSLKALSLRNDFLGGVHHLLAPDIFPVEVAHALTRAERRGVLASPDSLIKLIDVLRTRPDLHPC